MNSDQSASVVFAAGKGSRMVGYGGNKTLLPLLPDASIYEGKRPLLLEVLENLPSGPKGIVVHHHADEVRKATEGFGASYLFQAVTNGTGGAILAAVPFLESLLQQFVIITMGDVPLICRETYRRLIEQLNGHELVVLAFDPKDRAQYGMLEMEGSRVLRIVEWKYWRSFSSRRMSCLRFCNAGVYAAEREVLLRYLDRLAQQPHRVEKERGGRLVTIEEYFLTDLVELMSSDDLRVGVVLASEEEVSGVDTPEALRLVQARYARRG